MRIRKGDQVLIIKGKDRGRKAKVLRGFREEAKLLIEGVNIKKIHKKPKREGEKGQVVEVPSALDISKVKLICPKCGKPTKVRFTRKADKQRVRVCRECQEEI